MFFKRSVNSIKRDIESTVRPNSAINFSKKFSVFSEENKKRVENLLLSQTPLRIFPSGSSKGNQRQTQGGILIPLCYVDNEPSILFNIRSRKLKKHAGEVRLVLTFISYVTCACEDMVQKVTI